jgi:hypothetical protein
METTRHPAARVTYLVTWRPYGQAGPTRRRRCPDLDAALALVCQLLPEPSFRWPAEVDPELELAAVHRHETGPGYGHLAPVSFWQ